MAEAPLSENPDHCILAAVSEVCTTVAVGHDLFGQPYVRNDGKAVLHEVRRLVRKSAQSFESAACRALNEEFDDLGADTKAPRMATHDQRSYFGDVLAERGQFTATDHSIVLNRNEEAMHVRPDFREASGQEVPIF
jgi:hypothetical protein